MTHAKEPMEQQDGTPGIEVHEQMLNRFERDYLSGVHEAWAERTLTEADFREAMELLLAPRLPDQKLRRTVTANSRGRPG